MKKPPPDITPAVRLDVWLWAARFFKTRSLAKQAAEAGRVQIDGHSTKPGRLIHMGARLSIERSGERFEVVVHALSSQRGSATAAQLLYVEDAGSIERRRVERETARAERAGYSAPPSRPDKQQRRALKQLEQRDALPPWWPK